MCVYVILMSNFFKLQSTFVISKSKGIAEIFRDIRTLTYQICRTEGKKIEQPNFTNEVCNLTPGVRDVLKIFRKKRRNCSL